jgi:predicted phosphodiesterase
MDNHSAKTVVVMADTHVRTANELPRELLTAVRDADYVIHLGSMYKFFCIQNPRKDRNEPKDIENTGYQHE